ncbi:unnamed protein product [Albugo candida]|uniref:Uncharacterized protein n=1 Tax=Albugo candida TaxID=65357 RepID=A0A024FUE4_9STRA|nr:unnamed protein product [Albugo candida]|eukprot:CCI10507.1 unnamed protein product [Albugo candida]
MATKYEQESYLDDGNWLTYHNRHWRRRRTSDKSSKWTLQKRDYQIRSTNYSQHSMHLFRKSSKARPIGLVHFRLGKSAVVLPFSSLFGWLEFIIDNSRIMIYINGRANRDLKQGTWSCRRRMWMWMAPSVRTAQKHIY